MPDSVAIIGSRRWPHDSRHVITRFVHSLPPDTTIVSGGADGVDTFAYEAARERHMPTLVLHPEYARYAPKVAPLKRNETIAYLCDWLASFTYGESRGTINCTNHAFDLGRFVVSRAWHQADLPMLHISTDRWTAAVFVMGGKVVGGCPYWLVAWRKAGSPGAHDFCVLLRKRGAKLRRIEA